MKLNDMLKRLSPKRIVSQSPDPYRAVIEYTAQLSVGEYKELEKLIAEAEKSIVKQEQQP